MDSSRAEHRPDQHDLRAPHSAQSAVPLDAIVITEQLTLRPTRPPQYEAENRALISLAHELANSPHNVLQKLVELTLDLCHAHSAGVSLLEVDNGEEVFHWKAVVGQLPFDPRFGMPRRLSPCGPVVERNSAILYWRPERHFIPPIPYDPPVVEALLVPFHLHGKPVGTLWVIAHDEHKKFDAEDRRILLSLAEFAASAYQMHRTLEARNASDERYRTLFDSIDEGFCIIEVLFDPSGKPNDYRFLSVNPAFVNQTGFANAQGKTMREFDPLHEQQWFDIYGNVSLTGEPARFQKRAEQLNRWYDVYAFRIDSPELHHVAILFNDISKRRQAEEDLRESEHRLRNVIHNLAEGLIVIDPLTGALEWNESARRILGVDESSTEHYHLSSAADLYELFRLDGTPIPPHQWPALRILRGEDVHDLEVVMRRKSDGRERILSYGGTLVRDRHGQTALAFLTMRDITDLKKTQQQLIQNEKLATVGRMAATIAHEINNPLAGAMNTLYLALSTPGMPEDARANLNLADSELRRMAHITRQTLGFYRESGYPATLNIPEMLDGTLDLFTSKLRNKSIDVQRRYRGSGLAYGIEGELRQVFSNLISNSLDALPTGGTLCIRTAQHNGLRPMVRVTIADNGCGIRPENLKRIFEPFFTTKRSFGTGLGLWVTKELIKKHEGGMRVRSTLNKGTVFDVCIPLERRRDPRPAHDTH